MLPGKIVRFLSEQGNVGFVGVRDRNLRPSGGRVSGWLVSPDSTIMTALVPMPEQFQQEFLDALGDNGQFAVTIGEQGTHETYQLKGVYRGHRAITEADLAVVQATRERLARGIRFELPPPIQKSRAALVMNPDPQIAVEFEVREIYLQTPGPSAGARLYPSDAA